MKVPGQDGSLQINEIERIIDYLASNYPSINVRSIINEYKVPIQSKRCDVDT